MPTFLQTILDLAEAVAYAEGFNASPNNVPTRAHNPGDLKLTGYPTTGEEGISIFESDAVGWQHLYNQLERIRIGNSHIYWVTMTLFEFAWHWTDSARGSWLSNIIFKLKELGYNVDSSTTLLEFFNSSKN